MQNCCIKIIYCRGFMMGVLYILAIWHSRTAVNLGRATEESISIVNVKQQRSY